jgi:tetratricopeptide (TPR) repeat protein
MRSSFAILVTLLLALTATAQMTPAQNQAANPNAQPQTLGGAPNQSPSGAPSASSNNPQTPSSTAGGHKLPQAKTQDEFKAYQDAASKTDPAQMEAAANAFAAKYPNSDLKAAVYIRAMNLYGQANNSEKVIETGRKAIAADPTNPVPLVQVGSALVEGTRDTDMDRDQRLAEAAKDAQAAIDNIGGLLVPPNAPPDRVAAVKASILTMAYDTLGMVNLNKKDYATAEQQFLKAVDASKAQPEAVVYLRLSVAQDQLKQYPEALESANKAAQYAPPGSAAQNLAKQQQARLQKLIAGSPPAVPSSIAPVTPAPDTPTTQAPAQPAPAQTPPSPPH